MELYTEEIIIVEEDEILVEADYESTEEYISDTGKNEKAELFLAVIAKVSEPEVSYINEHSWLFGKG